MVPPTFGWNLSSTTLPISNKIGGWGCPSISGLHFVGEIGWQPRLLPIKLTFKSHLILTVYIIYKSKINEVIGTKLWTQSSLKVFHLQACGPYRIIGQSMKSSIKIEGKYFIDNSMLLYQKSKIRSIPPLAPIFRI